jgi:hypothetical protein
MEPFSITVGCIGLGNTAIKLGDTISKFVREVRSARSDLDAVGRELGSLRLILQTLQDDFSEEGDQTATFPETLKRQVRDILTNCEDVLQDIHKLLDQQKSSRLGEATKWTLRGKEDVKKLRMSLEAHRSALEIALEFATM